MWQFNVSEREVASECELLPACGRDEDVAGCWGVAVACLRSLQILLDSAEIQWEMEDPEGAPVQSCQVLVGCRKMSWAWACAAERAGGVRGVVGAHRQVALGCSGNGNMCTQRSSARATPEGYASGARSDWHISRPVGRWRLRLLVRSSDIIDTRVRHRARLRGVCSRGRLADTRRPDVRRRRRSKTCARGWD